MWVADARLGRAGTLVAVLAAATAALAFFAIGCIPKSEPSVVVALWFHTASFCTSVVPLAVRIGHADAPAGSSAHLLSGILPTLPCS
jgi:fatty acid desaturase